MTDSATHWPLLKSHSVLLADAQRSVQQAQVEYQSRVQLAFVELAEAREVDPATKAGALEQENGKLYFVVTDAPESKR